MSFFNTLAVIALLVFYTGLSAGDFSVADIFSDHMVLQQGKAVPVWGWAEPGGKITVEFKGQKLVTAADENGKWMIKLTPLKADPAPAVMYISSADDKKTFKDVLVGEVWLCSGQSNMRFPVFSSMRGRKMLLTANNPEIRLLKIPRKTAGCASNNIDARWQVCSPETAKGFSGVGYYFGLELFKALKVPVGLIDSSYGGTRIEPWTPPAGFAAVPQTKVYSDQISQADEDYRNQLKKYPALPAEWQVQVRENRDEKISNPPHKLNSRYAPSGLYNGMIAPLVPFSIRGAIWYQGEANVVDGPNYFYKMQALIKGWRNVWSEGDFPFYFVQIAPYNYVKRKKKLPLLWLGQYRAASEIKNCDLVFPGDVGNINDIHPRRKYPVGKRLALLALVNDYNKKIAAYKSPAFSNMKIDGSKLIISFSNPGVGFKTNDGKVPGEFMIAGKDGKYYPASVEIRGKTIVVSADEVVNPVSVKYAWHNLAVPNLISKEGLPVLPFEAKEENGILSH